MRRERWSIIGAILTAIQEEVSRKGPEARVTHVAVRANVPYDRLTNYLKDLEESEFITPNGNGMPKLTPKGREFLKEYAEFKSVLSRFGLDGR
jgi:predicted transcriptional regulator